MSELYKCPICRVGMRIVPRFGGGCVYMCHNDACEVVGQEIGTAMLEALNRRAPSAEQQQQEPAAWLVLDASGVEPLCTVYKTGTHEEALQRYRAKGHKIVDLYTHQQPQQAWFDALEDFARGPAWGGDDIRAYEGWVRETARKALECQQPQAQGEPVAWLHDMGNEATARLTFSPENPFGKPGRDYDASYQWTAAPLYKQPRAAVPDGYAAQFNGEWRFISDSENTIRNLMVGANYPRNAENGPLPFYLKPSPAVPDGYRLMPIDLSEEILGIAESECMYSADVMRSIYEALLAAVPAQPGEGE